MNEKEVESFGVNGLTRHEEWKHEIYESEKDE